MLTKFKYLFEATLPKNHMISSSSVLLGFIVANATVEAIPLLVLGLLINFGWLGGGNVLNMIMDFELDKLNSPNRPLPSGKITKMEVWSFYFFLISVAIVVSALLSWSLLIISLLGIFLGILYSVHPIRLKKVFPFNNMCIALAFGVISFLVGFFLISSDINKLPLWIPAFLFLVDVGGSIGKDYKDIVGDKIFKMKTAPTIFSKRNAILVQSFFLLPPYLIVLGAALMQKIEQSYLIVGLLSFIALYILLKLKGAISQSEYARIFLHIIVLATITRLTLVVGWCFAR